MNKKTVSIFVLSVLFFILIVFTQSGYAANTLKIFINGQELKSDVPAQIMGGRIMVPLRAVSENLNANVDWDDTSRTARISTQKPAQNEYKLMKLNGIQTTWPYWEEGGKLYMEYHNAMELLRMVYNPIFDPVTFSYENKLLLIGNRTIDVNLFKQNEFDTLAISELKRINVLNYEWNQEQGNLKLIND